MRSLIVFALLALVAEGSAFGQAERVVLEGRVVDSAGKPVAAANVLGTFEWDDSQSTFLPEQVATDGRFTIRTANTKNPRAIRVFAYAPGFSNAHEVKTPSKGARRYKPVVLALRPTIDFTVQIVDWSRKPVPTATVEIDKDSFSTSHPLAGVPQQVDAQGKVTFKGLNDADSFDLNVKAAGYLDVKWPHAVLTKPLEIQIAKGSTLRARILDHDTGAPLAVCKLGVEYTGLVTTDPKGNFTARVPYVPIHLTPDCDGYGPDYDLGMQGLVVDFTEANANQVHTLRARHAHVVHVRVVDGKGKPVAKTVVRRTFVSPNPHDIAIMRHGPPMEWLETDDKGEVVFKKSAMDRFVLTVDSAPKLERELRFADVRGTIVLTVTK